MKLQRKGWYRNRGRFVLAESNLTKRTKNWESCRYNQALGEFQFRSQGGERGVKYEYDFRLTTGDLLWMLDSARVALDSPSARAVVAGAIAQLRELLTPGEGSSQSAKFSVVPKAS